MFIDREGINMDFRGGGGDQVGCLNLQITPFNEKTPDSLKRFCANPKSRLPGG